jgi:hypothetical protein
MGKGRKEVYRLWWEYLKHSIPYKRYCEAMNKEFPEEERKIIHEAKGIMKYSTPPNLIAQAKDSFWPGYIIWGDPHTTSFEEFWKMMENDESPIQEASLQIGKFIKSRNLFSELIEKREPKYNSFIEDLSWYLQKNPNYIFLAVRKIPDMSIEAMGKIFCEILREKRGKMEKYVESKASYPWIVPTQPIRFDEVKRYLDVYDLHKKGKNWRKIANEIYPKKNFNNEIRITLIKEEKMAQKIIENVERGAFPGSY